MQILDIAKVCHEANRALCLTQGDDSQESWEEAPEWQRNSAIAGVEFHLANPDAPASAGHESWLKQKQAEGWEWGAEKDSIAKLHPCMVPYEHLPAAQQAKDHLFKAVVMSLAPFLESN